MRGPQIEPIAGISRPRNRRACAWYATDDEYALGAWVAIDRLRRLGLDSQIDLVVLHHRVSRVVLTALHASGARLIAADPPRPCHGWYFRDSLLKLRVFELVEYDRVVLIDADALPWSDLSILFALHLEESVALPRAWWLPQPYGTTALMVVRPSREAFEHLMSWVDARKAGGQRVDSDMNVVNDALSGQIFFLPAEHLALNGDWKHPGFMPTYGDPEAALSRVQAIHFSDLGKPWTCRPATVRRRRPDARPRYHELWELWWETRDRIVATRPWHDRLALATVRWRCGLGAWRRYAGRSGP